MSSIAISTQTPVSGRGPVGGSFTSKQTSPTTSRASMEAMSQGAPITVGQLRTMNRQKHNFIGSLFRAVTSSLNRIKRFGGSLLNVVTKRPTVSTNIVSGNNTVARQATIASPSGQTEADRVLKKAGFSEKATSLRENRVGVHSSSRPSSPGYRLNRHIPRRSMKTKPLTSGISQRANTKPDHIAQSQLASMTRSAISSSNNVKSLPAPSLRKSQNKAAA